MPNQINTIVWKLRENKQTLNILTELYDERILFDLAKTNHNFYVLPRKNKEPWNKDFRNKPDNIYLLQNYEECFYSLNEYAFDLFLSFTGMNDYLSFYLGIQNTKFLNDLSIDTNLFIPDSKKTNLFFYINGKSEVNHNEINYVTSNLNFLMLDNKNRRSFKDLLNIYKTGIVYLNFSKNEKMSLSMLEAMSSACCPIAFKTKENEKIIIHGENGFLCEDFKQMKTICEKVISSKEHLMAICNNARSTIVNKFSFDNYLNSWDILFKNEIKKNWWENI